MDTNTYTTKDIAAIFRVSHQAVKVWAREFANYLTPTARPAAGAKRVFKDDDVKVFALVREYTLRGSNFSDAHMALRAGQRGDIPDSPSAITAPPPQLLVALRDEISALRHQLQIVQTESDKRAGKVELLEKQLAEKEQRIEKLYEENARLKFEKKK